MPISKPKHEYGGTEMKTQLLLLVIVLVALAACNSSQAVEPTAQPEQEQATSAPTPTSPSATPTSRPATPTSPPATPTNPPPSPTPLPKLDELVMAAMAGWNSDQISPDQVDLTLSYFADDAVFKMLGFPPDIPSEFKGKEAIRAAFESWMPLHPKLEVKIEAVEGDTVIATTSYWSDPMRAMKVAPLVGKDVYIFMDGKIASETWTLTEETQSKLASAMATAAAPTPSPEALAASLDELVGNWEGYWSDQTSLYFEVKEGGGWRVYFPNGDEISGGTVTFEDGKLIFLSMSGNAAHICLNNPRAEYVVYVTKQGEQSIKLRFELVGEDQCADRKEFLNGRELTPVKP